MSNAGHVYPAILLKAGELYLKGDNRPMFVDILLSNIKRLIEHDFPDAEISGRAGKFIVSGYGHDARLCGLLRKVFGISLIDEVIVCPSDLETIRQWSLKLLEPLAGDRLSFKVASGRSWKKFPLTSMELNRIVGEQVVNACGMKVNLDRPDIVLKIRVDSKQSFVSVSSHPGAGGLPVGSSGRGLLLLSGGIDSPVAGWLAMRRGLDIQCLHFHSPPYTGGAALAKVEDLAAVLGQYHPIIVLHRAVFTAVQEFIRQKIREDYRVVMYRWAMLKIADRLARRLKMDALVTGENLGQVASQTIRNMACIEKASRLPVIRPLMTYDKAETIDLARGIGTYKISIRKAVDCCSLFIPRHPVTGAAVKTCLAMDGLLEESGVLDQCLDQIET